jgi:hypothetical protein
MLKKKKKPEEEKPEEEEPEDGKPEEKKGYDKLVKGVKLGLKKHKDEKPKSKKDIDPEIKNFAKFDEPIYIKKDDPSSKEPLYEKIEKPLFVKKNEDDFPNLEDKENELKPIEKTVFVEAKDEESKETKEPEEKKKYKVLKRIVYAKKKDSNKIYEKIGQIDDDKLKKFQKLAKMVYKKKPEGMEKMDIPIYIRTDDEPSKGKDGQDEEKTFIPISSELYIVKDGATPKDKDDNIDNYEKIEEPLFTKEFYKDKVLEKLGENRIEDNEKNYKRVDEPIFYKKVDPVEKVLLKDPKKKPNEIYQRLSKPLFIRKEDKETPEDKDYKLIEIPIYKIKESEEPDKEAFEPIEKLMFVRKEDVDELNDIMGKDDKGNDKQFQRLNKPIYYKKLDDEGKPISQDKIDDIPYKPGEFKTYDKLNKPVYIRIKPQENNKPTPEENEYEPISIPLYIIRDDIDKNLIKPNTNEDNIFKDIDVPIFIKKSDIDDIASKTKETPSDTQSSFSRITKPIYYKKIKIGKKSKEPQYERLTKPLYSKKQDVPENQKENDKYEKIKQPLFFVKDVEPKEGEEKEKPQFEQIEEPLYAKKDQIDDVKNEILGDNDLNKFRRINKPIFIRKKKVVPSKVEKGNKELKEGEIPDREKSGNIIKDKKPEDEFEYEKVEEPYYVRMNDHAAEGKEGKHEEKEFIPINEPIFTGKEGIKPGDIKETDIEKINEPVFVKKLIVDDVLKKLGEKDKDNKLKNYERINEPVFYKKIDPIEKAEIEDKGDKEPKEPKEEFQRIGRPLYIKRNNEQTPEDDDFKTVESEIYKIKDKIPKKLDSEEKAYEPIKKPIFVRKENVDELNDIMGKDDKGNNKQFQRLNKPVYFKINTTLSRISPSKSDFKTYDKLNQPVYIRTINSIPTIEDNDYIPISKPLYFLKPTIKPSQYKHSNINEDFLFDGIKQPLYIKKSDEENYINKTGGEVLDDKKLIKYEKVNKPVFYKKSENYKEKTK